jgi:hypothetical protein
MKLIFKLLIFLFVISFQSESLFAQDSLSFLQISKISNAKKVKQVDPNSYFKVKPHDGKKWKAKFVSANYDFIVSTTNDTIYFVDIKWINLKMKVSGFEKTAAITGVFAGSYLSFGTFPMAIYFLAAEGMFWPVIAPAATLTLAVIGYKTLAGRRYLTRKWKLEASTQFN